MTIVQDGDWPLRSLLFLPAHRASWVAKAIAAGPDGVILDLEDSVPDAEKDSARASVKKSSAALAVAGVRTLVRLSGFETAEQDLKSIVGNHLSAVILPKARTIAEISALADMLSHAEGAAGVERGRTGIICLPETAEGFRDSALLANASPRVTGLMTGVAGPVVGDIARAIGFLPSMEGSEQLYIQSKLVLDSRAAGANFPIAGIYGTPIEDLESVEMLIRRAQRLGFTGVALMHPSHIALANRIMRPTAEEIAYNRGLIEQLEAAMREGRGAIKYNGVMVDIAMLGPARMLVAEADRFAGKATGA